MNIRYVSIFSDIPKRILRFRPSSGQAGERRGPCRNHRGTEGAQLSYIWLPQDVAGAGEARYSPQSQDDPACHGEIRVTCGDPAAQKMGQSRAAGNQYENLLNRRFHADRPNRIFLTPTRSKAYYIYFYNHECIQLKNWSGAAHAAPLRLKLHISLYRDLFVLSAQAGAVHDPVGPVQPGFFAPIDNVPVRQI